MDIFIYMRYILRIMIKSEVLLKFVFNDNWCFGEVNVLFYKELY